MQGSGLKIEVEDEETDLRLGLGLRVSGVYGPGLVMYGSWFTVYGCKAKGWRGGTRLKSITHLASRAKIGCW